MICEKPKDPKAHAKKIIILGSLFLLMEVYLLIVKGNLSFIIQNITNPDPKISAVVPVQFAYIIFSLMLIASLVIVILSIYLAYKTLSK